MPTKRRPKGKCVLCGKLVWGAFAHYAEGIRHAECVPRRGLRYGVARKDKGEPPWLRK